MPWSDFWQWFGQGIILFGSIGGGIAITIDEWDKRQARKKDRDR